MPPFQPDLRGEVCFGSSQKKLSRDLYIQENQSARMSSPGRYNEAPGQITRLKEKLSHNKKQRHGEMRKRFEAPKTDVPGPGSY